MRLFTLLACSLLLVGCVQTTITHDLQRDGTVDVSVVFAGDDQVLLGFKNLKVNTALTDTLVYTEEAGNVTYLFPGIDPNQALFSSSIFADETYTLTKKAGFPYYHYTYTVELVGAGAANDTPKGLTSALFVVRTFGTVYNTDADRIDKHTVSFTADALAGTSKTIYFKESFLSAWLKL